MSKIVKKNNNAEVKAEVLDKALAYVTKKGYETITVV